MDLFSKIFSWKNQEADKQPETPLPPPPQPRPRSSRRGEPRYQSGDRIGGRYQVYQALLGGMGEVYLCLDLEKNYPYALKTFQAHLKYTKARELFEVEVTTWVTLEKHPHIVRCFYLDVIDKQPFMLLEWVASDESHGTDLRSWLRHGPLELGLALNFTLDICRGLIHADQKQPGIVHRDLKPDNVLVAQGRIAKITDFGLAKIVQGTELAISDEEASGPHLSNIGGTPLYMAPEQWLGDELDQRTDIYAVGCILYELLTGRWPFDPRAGKLRHQHLEASVSTLVQNEAIPTSLENVLAKCLAKRREDRWTTINDLLQELSQVYEQQFAATSRIIPVSDEFTAVDFNDRGATYARLGRHNEALVDYDQAIKLDPTYALAYNNRAVAYQDLERYREALPDHNRAIELDPTDPQSYTNRGNTHHNLNHYNEALADHTQAIELDPSFAGAYYNRGNAHISLQHYHKAQTDYSRAIDLDPNYVEAYANRGITYQRQQQDDEALADWRQAIKLDPNFALAHFNIGIFHYKRKEFSEALPYLEKAGQLGISKAEQLLGSIRMQLLITSGQKDSQETKPPSEGKRPPIDEEKQRAWDYCENCGKTGAKLYQGGGYAFCSDSCRDQFGRKLLYSRVQIYCPFCGEFQEAETGARRDDRICIKCEGNMDKLLEKI